MSVMSSLGSFKRAVPALALCLGLSYPALAAGKARKVQDARQGKPARKADKVTAPRLSAAEIVQKHVAARGGLKAWRAVKTLSMAGKMDAGTGDSVARSMQLVHSSRKKRREIAATAQKTEPEKQVQLPFKLAKQRPNKSRLEIQFAGKTAVQVYDGENGWKFRPYLNRTDVEPFTSEEAKSYAQTADMDDPLIDSAANGAKVKLEGVEKVEGRAAYKLKLTSKSGAEQRIWVDATTFLDVKVEGVPRRMDGRMHSVFMYQRDFRGVDGVKIPFVIETVVDGYPQSHKIIVDKVAVNPRLDAAMFTKPKA